MYNKVIDIFYKILFVVFVLFITSIQLFGWAYTIVKKIITKDDYKGYMIKLLPLLSQNGNYFLGDFLNDLAYKKHGYKEINIDESISSKTGKNKKNGTLRMMGIFIDWGTGLFEKEHTIKEIDENP